MSTSIREPYFIAWAAGFFDGEGCVMIHRRQRSASFIEHYVTAVVGQKRIEPLKEFKAQFGGVLTKLTTSGCYQWRAHGSTAERFYKSILPYLRLKGAEVECALEIRKTVGSPGTRVPREIWLRREEIWKSFRNIRDGKCTTS